jgi:C1A family cysteine protease
MSGFVRQGVWYQVLSGFSLDPPQLFPDQRQLISTKHHQQERGFMKYLAVLLSLFSVLAVNARGEGFTPYKHGRGFIKTQAHGLAKGAPFIQPKFHGTIPTTYSLVANGFEPPTRDQGSCGSCWAFASTMTLDYSALMFAKLNVVLSEEEVVAYDTDFQGCNGGDFAGDFLVKNGLVLDSDCPYQDGAGCPNGQPTTFAAKPASWANIGTDGGSPTTQDIQAAILQYGAVAVDVAASGAGWESYSGGVYSGDCSDQNIDHLVTIVGWNGTDNAWYVKNSWGESWGEKIPGSKYSGYIEMPYGCDAIASDAASLSYNN